MDLRLPISSGPKRHGGDSDSDIMLIENPDRNFLVIMKNGTVYKNRLSR